MKRTRRPPMSEAEWEAALGFKLSVRGGACAACGEAWDDFSILEPHVAHHVVYRQHLPKDRRWDKDNALPLCSDCHERHHNASRRVPRSALTAQNVAFASEVLGAYAPDYLDRHYATEESEAA